jgi:GcrA cell cycle regulator
MIRGDKKAKVLDALDGTRTPAEIADILNVSVCYVTSLAARHRRPYASSSEKPYAGRWTKDRLVNLRQWWCVDGLSASVIAARLGDRFTRSSITGKVHRLGWQQASKGTPKRAVPPITSQQKKARRPREQSPWAGNWSAPKDPVINPIPPPTDTARKSLADLGDEECRWPVGDPGQSGFGFCADPVVIARPYCEHHCARAYQAPFVRSKKDNSDQHISVPDASNENADASRRVREGV